MRGLYIKFIAYHSWNQTPKSSTKLPYTDTYINIYQSTSTMTCENEMKHVLSRCRRSIPCKYFIQNISNANHVMSKPARKDKKWYSHVRIYMRIEYHDRSAWEGTCYVLVAASCTGLNIFTSPYSGLKWTLPGRHCYNILIVYFQ